MSDQVLQGAPASPGVSLGVVWRRVEAAPARERANDPAREVAVALGALDAAARELTELGATLGGEQAAIIEAGALMAQDPALARAVETGVLQRDLSAADAILAACEELARAIAAVGDEMLAARADDVRSLGRRAARLAGGDASVGVPPEGAIVIASDLGPGDVAELAASVAGFALAAGGSTAHAAIVARSLGLPMVTGLGPGALQIAPGTDVALDGAAGTVVIAPSREEADAAAHAMASRTASLVDVDDGPARTRDDRRIAVLANVASAAEVEVALRGGAEGVGLVRTELAFLEARAWPDEPEHSDALEPILAGLEGRGAVVRVLDFGADKAPPFLSGVKARGLELLLVHEREFVRQLRAIVVLAQRHQGVRVMLPLVESAAQMDATRALLERTTRSLGIATPPPLGAMIETAQAVRAAPEIARRSAFLSIGTNDLTADVLGHDRFAVNGASAHDPRVLRCIAHTVAAGHAAGLKVEVCGEAASDPLMVPLLIGLRVDELSVGAARVATVRRLVRDVNAADAGRVARSTLSAGDADEVAALASA